MIAKIPVLDRFAQCREPISDEALRRLRADGCNDAELGAYAGIGPRKVAGRIRAAIQAETDLLNFSAGRDLRQTQAGFIGLRTTLDALPRPLGWAI